MQDIMSFNQKETPKDIWKHYDPEKAREGLRKSAGALKALTAMRSREISKTNGNRIVRVGLPKLCRIWLTRTW